MENIKDELPAVVSIDPNNTIFAAVKHNFFHEITRMIRGQVKGADVNTLYGYMKQIITPEVRIVCIEQQFGSRTLCTIQGMLVGLAKALAPTAKVMVVNANHYRSVLGIKKGSNYKNKKMDEEESGIIENYFCDHPEDDQASGDAPYHHLNDCVQMNKYLLDHYL